MLREEKRQTRMERTRQRPVPCCTQVLIGIEGMERGEPYGCIHHHDMKKLVPFWGMRELIFRIMAIDQIVGGSPSASDLYIFCLPEEYREISRLETKTREEIQAQLHAMKIKEVFSLQIMGRQNASLQGWIRGSLTGGKMILFHSVLELMYLLSDTLMKKQRATSGREDIRQSHSQE